MNKKVQVSFQEEKNEESIISRVSALYKSLSKEEQEKFLEEVSILEDTNSKKVNNLIIKIKNLIKTKLILKKGPTKIKIQKPGKIATEGIKEETIPVNITVKSLKGHEKEIQDQLNRLCERISLKFGIDTFKFIELFYEYFTQYYYYLITDENTDVNSFFPEGYIFDELDGSRIISSHDNYVMNNYSALKVLDVHNNLNTIFKEQFPNLSEKRIKAFINKTRLPVEILNLYKESKEN